MPAVPADFFVPHALEAYRLMGAPGEEGDAEIVVNAFKAAGVREMTKNEMYMRCRCHIPKAKRLEEALTYLMEKDWVRKTIVPTGGRPMCRITLNPKITL